MLLKKCKQNQTLKDNNFSRHNVSLFTILPTYYNFNFKSNGIDSELINS